MLGEMPKHQLRSTSRILGCLDSGMTELLEPSLCVSNRIFGIAQPEIDR